MNKWEDPFKDWANKNPTTFDITSLTNKEYLFNRLFHAYQAGRKYGNAEQQLVINEACDLAKAEIVALKQKLQDTLQREYILIKKLKTR